MECYQEALNKAGHSSAVLIDYRDLIADRAGLADGLADSALMRIESPGRSFDVYKALLIHGYEDAVREEVPKLAPDSIVDIRESRGLLLCPTQFFLGFRRVLDQLALRLEHNSSLTATSHPTDIVTLFDKRKCHRMLRAAGIPTPGALGDDRIIRSYDHLRDAMAASKLNRVFVKLQYGSSAAGVVAYQTNGRRELAITTAEMVREGNAAVSLFSNRRVCRYENPHDIRTLFDSLCPHGVHVEAWFPKAGLEGSVCDLRVLMIAGQPRHVVLRRSRTPLTNLHLLNQRSDATPLRQRMSADAWDSMMDTCTRVAAMFPRSLHLGIDVAVGVNLREHAVLEVNAFGDLLKNVTDRGQTTYEAEIEAIGPWRITLACRR